MLELAPGDQYQGILLIGSFIAATLGEEFDATLFRIGVLAYASYVLVFPGIIGLAASYLDLRRARGEFEARRRHFDEALTVVRVDCIVQDRITTAQRHFKRWTAFIAAVYILIAVAGCIAAVHVPRHVRGGTSTSAADSTGSQTP